VRPPSSSQLVSLHSSVYIQPILASTQRRIHFLAEMNSSIKRLAKDHLALRKSLPPNYLFETEHDLGLPDDLTQLLICLTGPEGTPYSRGLWHIRLDIPVEYPSSPPTATFKTRIFHPNVAEETGAVCLETLKRDWDPKLTLRDILITISCLLIQPNPDSALNQKAGALIQEDYDAFARQARLMTRIHAPISAHLLPFAQEARRRGEEDDSRCSDGALREFSTLPTPAEDGILKENQPVQDAECCKVGNEKPLKRPLADVSSSTEATQEEQLRRKSPKYRQCPGVSTDAEIAERDPKRTGLVQHSSISNVPNKIIFRAQWSMPSGLQRTTARVGIRRL